MTALLKKDLYVLSKQVGIIVPIVLALSFIPRMESFGTVYVVVLAMMMPANSISSDELSHWDKYAVMLPFRPRQIVRSKYLLALIMTLASVVVNILLQGVHAIYQNDAAAREEAAAATAVMVLFMIVVNLISIPLVYRFGPEKGRVMMMLLMFALSGLIVLGARKLPLEDLVETVIRLPLPAACLILAAIAAVCVPLSISLSTRFYIKRRDGAYI